MQQQQLSDLISASSAAGSMAMHPPPPFRPFGPEAAIGFRPYYGLGAPHPERTFSAASTAVGSKRDYNGNSGIDTHRLLPLVPNKPEKSKALPGQSVKNKKYNTRYPLPEKPRQKRAVIQDMVRPLKQWLLRHRHNPYPTKAEKVELAVGSNMSLVQVSNWFANARRRLKNVVQDPRCSWSKRLRMYNQFVQGNAELISIASNDSIWNSDSEEEDEDDDERHPMVGHIREGAICRPDSRAEEEIDVDGTSRSSFTLHRTISADAINTDDESQMSKYKKSMMQRYLHDSVENSYLEKKSAIEEPAAARKRKLDEDKVETEQCPKRVKTDVIAAISRASPPLPPVQQPLPLSLPVLDRVRTNDTTDERPSAPPPPRPIPGLVPPPPPPPPSLPLFAPSAPWLMGPHVHPMIRMLHGLQSTPLLPPPPLPASAGSLPISSAFDVLPPRFPVPPPSASLWSGLEAAAALNGLRNAIEKHASNAVK